MSCEKRVAPPPISAAPSPDPTVSPSRKVTEALKRSAQERYRRIIQAVKDARTVKV